MQQERAKADQAEIVWSIGREDAFNMHVTDKITCVDVSPAEPLGLVTSEFTPYTFRQPSSQRPGGPGTGYATVGTYVVSRTTRVVIGWVRQTGVDTGGTAAEMRVVVCRVPVV